MPVAVPQWALPLPAEHIFAEKQQVTIPRHTHGAGAGQQQQQQQAAAGDMTESLRSEEVRSIAAQQRGRPSAESQDEAAFDYAAKRFRYSIVWQPFPVHGWILPCIGHMGIADSQGVVYDFQGPYTIMCVRPAVPARAPRPAAASSRPANACV